MWIPTLLLYANSLTRFAATLTVAGWPSCILGIENNIQSARTQQVKTCIWIQAASLFISKKVLLTKTKTSNQKELKLPLG